MVRSERERSTRPRGMPGRRCSWNRNNIWVLAGAVLLVVLLVASVAGCSSSTQATSNTTGTSLAAGQTGTSSNFPNGTPPTDANGQQMTPPSGGMPGNSGSSSTTTTEATTSTTDASTTTTEATTTTTIPKGSYGSGTYHAGYSISTGLYKGNVTGKVGHWEITSDANGDKYVASGDPTGQFYVKVTSGQYLWLDGVWIKKASSTAADPLKTKDISDGSYRVGYDIAAGWYAGTVNATMGYWEISSDANGTTLVANDYPLDSFKIKVAKGQYVTLRGVTISQ
jgi:hypothetical protein